MPSQPPVPMPPTCDSRFRPRARHLIAALAVWLALNVATLAAQPSVQVVREARWPSVRNGIGAIDVKVVGRFAYVAMFRDGLRVIDVSNPTNLVQVRSYNTGGHAWGVTLSGNFAYVANQDQGLQVFDVSNPPNFVRVGGYGTSGTPYAVAVAGNYAYVSSGYAGLQIIDVSNPTNCLRVGGYATGGFTYEVELSGDYAYVATGTNGLAVFHVSEGTNLVYVGGMASVYSTRGVKVRGNHAYVVDAVAGLRIFDVSNPSNCIEVSSTRITNAVGRAIQISGNQAFVSAGSGGLHVFEVSNPANPVRVAGYKAGGYVFTTTIADGRIYVADGNEGLFVVPTLPNVQFTVRVEAETNQPFTLEAATDLAGTGNWSPLVTTNVPAMPFDFVDFDVKLAEKLRKFYRVRQP